MLDKNPEWATYGYMWDGLDQTFAKRLDELTRTMGGHIKLISGYRSHEHQQYLYDQAVNRYGQARAEAILGQPGHSNHERGLAADVRFLGGRKTVDWLKQNVSRFGLVIPMSYEPWHLEPNEIHRDMAYSDGAPLSSLSYPTPPPGIASPLTRTDSQKMAAMIAQAFTASPPQLTEGTSTPVEQASQEAPPAPEVPQ